MTKSVSARSSIGIAAATMVGVASIATATNASADPAISASPAYCVGTTYTITLPAADADALIASEPPAWTPATSFQFIEETYPGLQVVSVIATVPYVKGQAATAQWTPTAAGQSVIRVSPAGTSLLEATAPITVVQNAPAGSSCTPSTGGTGSASSIPVIGPLLSGLSG